MQEKAKEPEIRFAGFTGAWEQRKIKDLAANTYGGGTPSTSNPDFWEGSIPWIQSSDLSEHNLFRVRPRKFISQAAVTNSPVKIIPESSIAVITRVGVGKLAVMNFSYTTSQDFLSLSNLNTDVKFTSYQLYRRLQKDLNAVQGTSIKGITKEELLGKNIFIPGRQEQEAIGKFFSKIDSLLTLHQRKYEKLLNIKKSMLEKMFPKEGEVVPEIRFKGFTGAWEQRKIGDYLTLSKIPGHTGVDAKKLTVKLWGKGVVEKTDIYGGSQNTQYYVRRAGQFMYGKLDFLHAAFGIVPKSLDRFESTLDSPAFDLHEIDGAFLQNRVTQQNFYLKFGNIANGSRKAKRIHEVTFLDMPIVVPSYAEQKKIGAFLNKLDSLLTLHQRKLEMLKNVKQAFLEKMFV